jgi:hypothetical protein
VEARRIGQPLPASGLTGACQPRCPDGQPCQPKCRFQSLAAGEPRRALAALREDTQGWWADVLARNPEEMSEGEEPATADAEGLRCFLEGEVLPWFENRKKELANRPLIREQAFGEALDPDKLERLGRYEVHLDRKLERMLTMLLRLKDLRQGAVER